MKKLILILVISIMGTQSYANGKRACELMESNQEMTQLLIFRYLFVLSGGLGMGGDGGVITGDKAFDQQMSKDLLENKTSDLNRFIAELAKTNEDIGYLDFLIPEHKYLSKGKDLLERVSKDLTDVVCGRKPVPEEYLSNDGDISLGS